MNKSKYPWPEGPWQWIGEDYRGGWGWAILADVNGAGIACSQGLDGGPEPQLRAHIPIDPDLCVPGMNADLQSHVESFHVMETAAPLIQHAPELFKALEPFAELLHMYEPMEVREHPELLVCSVVGQNGASRQIFLRDIAEAARVISAILRPE
jgi:hypothetical protein